MGVFDGNVKIPLRVADPLTDKSLGDSGLLPWGSITSLTGLAGTTGTDCKLVHGDRWQEIQGNMNEHYTLNVNTTIDQNWTIQVNGIMNLTVVMGYNEEEQGPVNRHYVKVVTDTFDSDHNVSVPDSFAFTVSMFSNTLVIATQIGICTGLFVALTTALSITVANFDLEAKLFHAEAHPLHFAWAGNDTTASISSEHFKALRAAVSTEARVSATVNALLDLDTGTPFT
jgi:hypothetical protein